MAHVLSDKTEAAYQCGDMLKKRRKLMQNWADYATEQCGITGNVVRMRG